MQFRISFTIMIGALILLFLLGCGGDEINDGDSGPPKPETFGSLTGKVVDENGNPVSGAIITTEPETSQIITAADGSYVIPNVPSKKYTIRAKKGDQEGTAVVKVEGGEVTADIRLTEAPEPPAEGNEEEEQKPPGPEEITMEITFPKPNDKVGWRARITGKLLGAKNIKALKDALNLKDETLKISLWVWDPKDPHGPWKQPPATIKNNLEWVEDEPAWFGRAGQDIGVKFNVRAELAIQKGNDLILIAEVKPVTITNVIRK